jgi:putative ATP-dependent endonuclease of OLD family
MYLAELKIWNFRKFGLVETKDGILPGLHIEFDQDVNVLVGENDSGKTAIIDAIKYVLQTRSYDSLRPSIDDFYVPNDCSQESCRADSFTIECKFKGFDDREAKNFLEWLAVTDKEYWLRVFLVATRSGRTISYDCKAGLGEGAYLDGNARDLLRVTYLKPLRDAEGELAPRKGSRISQILDSHDAFAEKDDHELVKIVSDANAQIENFFDEGQPKDHPGRLLHDDVDSYLREFSDASSPLVSRFSLADMRLKGILERLRLSVFEHTRKKSETLVDPGLGSNNLLFVAAELLLLKKAGYDGLRLGLIEEIEAHLHPQAQLRLIEYLQSQSSTARIQLILTTHSPNLASKTELRNLIVCKNGLVFPMGDRHTKLQKGDYRFLERFLDTTKASMFFAKGVILVEGDAESLLIPAIAQIIGYPISKHGIAIINVGSTALLRYSKIYQREVGPEMPIPVSVINDLDIRPDKYKEVDPIAKTWADFDVEAERTQKCLHYEGQKVKAFVSTAWTLEYTIALSSDLRWLLLKSNGCDSNELKEKVSLW